MPMRNVALKTYQKQWTIENGTKKESGISVLTARNDDDYISSSSHHLVPSAQISLTLSRHLSLSFIPMARQDDDDNDDDDIEVPFINVFHLLFLVGMEVSLFFQSKSSLFLVGGSFFFGGKALLFFREWKVFLFLGEGRDLPFSRGGVLVFFCFFLVF